MAIDPNLIDPYNVSSYYYMIEDFNVKFIGNENRYNSFKYRVILLS